MKWVGHHVMLGMNDCKTFWGGTLQDNIVNGWKLVLIHKPSPLFSEEFSSLTKMPSFTPLSNRLSSLVKT